jgi:heptosyltransferase-2
MLVTELWGLGDMALAIPFLRSASEKYRVQVVAKEASRPLLERFAPSAELLPFAAPWTAFRGKYRLHSWPWRKIAALARAMRSRAPSIAVSARPDPRDHVLLAMSGAPRKIGFGRAGSSLLLTDSLVLPDTAHRADHWAAVAAAAGVGASEAPASRPPGRRVLIHTGAAQPTRRWPADRYQELARRIGSLGWSVEVVDDSLVGVPALVDKIASADRFVGNDSGPGHIAALLGVPTFTIFGPQLPEKFAPIHKEARWIEGGACPYKPCSDYCRFGEPKCLLSVDVDSAMSRLQPWLET